METVAQKPLILTRWTRQGARAPAALAPGYARLDERNFADLLAEFTHFARCVRYWNPDNVEDGDWGSLLTDDAAVLLALIATLDLEERAEAIRRLLRRARGKEALAVRERALRTVLEEVVDLAGVVDDWVDPSERAYGKGPGHEAAELIVRILDSLLAPLFRRLHALLRAIERAGYWERDVLVVVGRFHGRWSIDEVDEIEIGWISEAAWLDSVTDPVGEAVEGFLSGLEALVAESREGLAASLDHGRHAPHIGLALAFLKLFGHEQERLNALLPKLARHFHERIVGASARPAYPDRTYLAFQAAAGGQGLPPLIPKGMVFEAGTGGDGNPVRFATDRALAVSRAAVSQLRIWQPELAGGVRRRVGVLAAAVDASGSVAATFAAAAAGPLPAAELGLILAGPALDARSGARRFDLTLRLRGVEWPSGADAEGFAAVLKSCFRLSILTDEGWFDLAEVETDGSRLDGAEAEARFRFALAADSPATVAAAPALRLLLLQDARAPASGGTDIEVAPLPVFAQARVTGGGLDLAVDGLGDLVISTSSAPAASALGLAPFGVPAARGGWMQLDHPVLARGGIERLDLTLRWTNPPPHADGFTGYYRQYVVGLDRRVHGPDEPLIRNDSFRVRLAAPVARGVQETDYLLFSGGASGRVDPVSGFTLSAGPSDSPPPPAEGRPSVRLTLTGPEHGFGDLLYPLNVARATQILAAGAAGDDRKPLSIQILLTPVKILMLPAMLLKALGKLLKKLLKALGKLLKKLWDLFFLTPDAFKPEEEPWDLFVTTADSAKPEDPSVPVVPAPPDDLATLMPNPPWRPVLAGLTLDYRAHFDLAPAPAASTAVLGLLHWTPLDGPAPVAWEDGAPLLPPLPAEPSFDISMDGADAGAPLSLLFVVDRASAASASRWLVPGEERGPALATPVADSTESLARSGIVAFGDSPARLRVVTDGGFPQIGAIMANAVSATRRLGRAGDPVAPLAAGAIRRMPPVKGVASVHQPLASFGGVPAEGPGDVATRTSEALRHKGRAVLEWDCERLVLDSLPEVDRLRILPARGRDGEPKAGGILAVIVPAPGGPTPPDPERPSASAALCGRVEAALSARSSASAKVAAVGAVYVSLDVSASVALAPDADLPRLEADIRAFLSPWGAEGPDLPDSAAPSDIAGALVRYLRNLEYVEAVADVAVALADESAPRPWLVPVAGKVDILLLEPESFGP
ncbi:MAG TPA: hypothetical protein VEW26_04840 [Allosphingosinicella sp.]|nr:hypothetical protein [Allosphingosinicella sp.]